MRIAIEMACGHTFYAHRARADLLGIKGQEIGCFACQLREWFEQVTP